MKRRISEILRSHFAKPGFREDKLGLDKYNVGVQRTKTYELKEVSDDFFEEDEG